MNRKTILSFAALILFLIVIWTARGALLVFLEKQRILAMIDSVHDRWWAPPAFILIYAGFCAVALPALIPTLIGGATWGPVWGTVYNMIASNLGASAAFFIARYLGRAWVRKFSSRLAKFEKGMEKNGFQTILTLRLIPIFPFNGINFGAGLSSIRYRDYLLGSLIGMLPGTFIYTYFAASLLSGAMEGRDAFGKVAVAGLLLAALSLIPKAYQKYRMTRKK